MEIKKPVFVTTLTVAILGVVTAIYLPIHFLVISPRERYQDYSFKYWNDCKALNELKSYVKESVNSSGEHYVPKEDRIATFDMDGTIFAERSPIYVEFLMYQDYFNNYFQGNKSQVVTYNYYKNGAKLERSISLQDTYDEVAAFINGSENEFLELDEANCGAYLFSGINTKQYDEYVKAFMNKEASNLTIKYKDMYYRPMKEVLDYLKLNNFDCYIVSGSDRNLVRYLCCDIFNQPTNKVIGSDVSYLVVNNELVRGSELKYKNVKDTKIELISQEIGKNPVLSFGNSSGDVPMHRLTLSNPKYNSKSFMVVNDDIVRENGYAGEVLAKRIATWNDFYLISMANDWKTIYGDNVTKK